MFDLNLVPDRPYEVTFLVWFGLWHMYIWALAHWSNQKLSASVAFFVWLGFEGLYINGQWASLSEAMQLLTIYVCAATPFYALFLWSVLVFIRKRRGVRRHKINEPIAKDFDEANPDGFRRKFY